MARSAALQRTWILVLNPTAQAAECLVLLLSLFSRGTAMRSD